MRIACATAILAIVFLAGCASEKAPPSAHAHRKPPVADRQSSLPSVAEKEPVVRTVKKPPTVPDKQSAEQAASVRATDDFGLPLVIVLEVPEVPKEIRGPSPPIKEDPKETPKKSRGWWW